MIDQGGNTVKLVMIVIDFTILRFKMRIIWTQTKVKYN